jgi:circadian clock protein KaiC
MPTRRTVTKARRATKSRRSAPSTRVALPKTPTGIAGLDEVTGGGLPRGRPTLVCGAAGCGKSLLGIEFLVRGALEFGEPGVLMSFEERPEDLEKNVASLGFDLRRMVRRKQISLDYVHVERNDIEESGDYDLEGLFVRLGHAIDTVGAKRVVLDTIESLFAGLSNQAVLRAEIRRLFQWLKDRGITAVVTGERGEATLTRQGLEEYVSDCVILLDHRVVNQVSTRRVRVVKYRGSTHGTNEYPFLIDEDGISVLPITSLSLAHTASQERVSTGIPALDEMLGGKGCFRGNSILVSGTSGTGKTTVSASFANAACGRGERTLYFAFEESETQLVRNMRSVGMDLERWTGNGLLRFMATRPSFYGLEMHLATMHKVIDQFRPKVVVVDQITNLMLAGDPADVQTMLLRLVDFLKVHQITAVFTSLTHAALGPFEATEVGVSSLMDTWILLRDIELAGERNRGIYVLKSRGMKHSNQIREFLLTDRGVQLRDVYLGRSGVLTGSARMAEEAESAVAEADRLAEIAAREAALDRRRAAIHAQISALQAEMVFEETAVARLKERDMQRTERVGNARSTLRASRRADRTASARRPQTRSRT